MSGCLLRSLLTFGFMALTLIFYDPEKFNSWQLWPLKIEGTLMGKEIGLQGALEPMKSLCFIVRLVFAIFPSEPFPVSDTINNKFGDLKTPSPVDVQALTPGTSGQGTICSQRTELPTGRTLGGGSAQRLYNWTSVIPRPDWERGGGSRVEETWWQSKGRVKGSKDGERGFN